MDDRTQFSVVPSISADQKSAKLPDSGIAAEIAPPPVRLNAREKKIWQHVTQALLEYGLIHRTDSMMLTVIVRTFDRWVSVEDELEKFKKKNDGSFVVKTPNGYEQPHQLFYAARDLKNELLKWLPEAALTITSFHKIKAEDLRPTQGDMFDDPIESFRRRRATMAVRPVPNGK